jgi:predicted acyl esterase
MTRHSLRVLPLLLACACAALPTAAVHAAAAANAADAADAPAAARDLRETYTKYEYSIPMRDGTRLFTVV